MTTPIKNMFMKYKLGLKHRILFYVVITFLALGVALFITQHDQSSHHSGNLTTLEQLRDKADTDPKAQYQLGWSYDHGDGVEQDYVQAAEWYRKAANAGHPRAQNELGGLYENGHGVEQDYEQAMEWYRKAAAQDHPTSIGNLGRMYLFGFGLEQDYAEASEWFRKAAEMGHAESQNSLANLHLDGNGVAKDDVEAAKWKRKAAEAGLALAQTELGSLYFSGRGVEQDRIEAGYWYRKAADGGNEEAIGFLREASLFCTEAVKGTLGRESYCLVSAGAGYPDGQFSVGTYHDSGHFLSKDKEKASEWFRKAAEQGHALAQALLGKALAEGDGVPRDDTEAYAWFSVLANHTPHNDRDRFAVEGAIVMKTLLLNRMSETEKSEAKRKSEKYNELYLNKNAK